MLPLQDIITRRLVRALLKIGDPEFDIEPGTVLGGEPPAGLGFDAPSLRQVLDELNGNRLGFADLLERRLIQNEVTTSTKVSALAAVILQKSMVRTGAEYEMKVSERVRLALRTAIANLADIEEEEVVPTESLERYLARTDENVDRLRQSMTETLEKYLFSSITRSDIQGTVGRIQRRIVVRMIF